MLQDKWSVCLSIIVIEKCYRRFIRLFPLWNKIDKVNYLCKCHWSRDNILGVFILFRCGMDGITMEDGFNVMGEAHFVFKVSMAEKIGWPSSLKLECCLWGKSRKNNGQLMFL